MAYLYCMPHASLSSPRILPGLVKVLAEATDRILLAVGWLERADLLELLRKKADEGVTVHLALFDGTDGTAPDRLAPLLRAGGQVSRLAPDQREHLMDHKFGIVDEAVLTGTYGWGHRTAPRDEQLHIATGAPYLLQGFREEFDYLAVSRDLPSASATGRTNSVLPLLKKLDVLQVLLRIGDTDFLEPRLTELVPYTEDPEIARLIELLQTDEIEEGLAATQAYIEVHQPLLAYIEPPLQLLRREIQRLEEELAATSRAHNETEKTLKRFSQEHSKHLGDLLQEILLQSKLKAKYEASLDEEKEELYESAKADHEAYTDSREQAASEAIRPLTRQEQKELKKLYRRTSLQCHPDRVVDELHDEAEHLFIEVNEAYKANDLDRLRELSEQLEGLSMAGKAEGITELKKLRGRVANLEQKLADALTKLNKLHEQPVYQTVSNIPDWDVYFEDTKRLLNDQLERLVAFNTSVGATLSEG